MNSKSQKRIALLEDTFPSIPRDLAKTIDSFCWHPYRIGHKMKDWMGRLYDIVYVTDCYVTLFDGEMTQRREVQYIPYYYGTPIKMYMKEIPTVYHNDNVLGPMDVSLRKNLYRRFLYYKMRR